MKPTIPRWLNLLVWMTVAVLIYAAVVATYSTDLRRAAREAAKPFQGHDDLITGPGPSAVSRATGADPGDAFEDEAIDEEFSRERKR